MGWRKEIPGDFVEGAAHSTALEPSKVPIDPGLDTVTTAWHTLPLDFFPVSSPCWYTVA